MHRLGRRWRRIAFGLMVPLLAGEARALDATTYTYPLRVSADHRYLVDQNNKPFRIQGDSAQSLIANLTSDEADVYFSNRQARGFNTVNINLLEHKFAVNAPANRSRAAPFTTAGNFSTPNEAYFAFADQIIDLAASKGMLVSLAYMYLGAHGGDEGWWAELTNSTNTQTVCYDFGLYLGNRYKDRKNILWVVGGDFFPPQGSEGETRLHRILDGIKAAGATQLQTGDWSAPGLSTDEAAFASSMDVNAVYTYGPGNNGATYDEARAGYNHSPTIPAYLKETGYEAEGWIPGDPASIRKYQYWAILGGSTAGGFYGHRDVWEFATDSWSSGFPFGHQRWQNSLDAPGALDWQRLGQLFDSLPWYKLVPSGLGMRALVTAGGGMFGGSDYVTAAAMSDGKVLLAYVPPTGTAARSITVDMVAMSGSARARWFNPTSGAYTSISSSLPNTGTQQFTTPGNNGAGSNDWVLVLDVVSTTSCTTGSQCSSGFCVDGYCCNSACTGQCEACDAVASVGTCIPVAGSPHGARSACSTDGGACGSCDGVNRSACAYSGGAACIISCTDNTQCTAGKSCVNGVCTSASSSRCGCSQSSVDGTWLLALALVDTLRRRRTLRPLR